MQNLNGNYFCPTCGSDDTFELADTTIAGNPRIKCRICKQRFTANTALKKGEAPELTAIFDSDGLGITITSTKVLSLDQLLPHSYPAFPADRKAYELHPIQ